MRRSKRTRREERRAERGTREPPATDRVGTGCGDKGFLRREGSEDDKKCERSSDDRVRPLFPLALPTLAASAVFPSSKHLRSESRQSLLLNERAPLLSLLRGLCDPIYHCSSECSSWRGRVWKRQQKRCTSLERGGSAARGRGCPRSLSHPASLPLSSPLPRPQHWAAAFSLPTLLLLLLSIRSFN